MILLVAKVLEWHDPSTRTQAKKISVHSSHRIEETARIDCSRLNSGRRKRAFWIVDKKGRVFDLGHKTT